MQKTLNDTSLQRDYFLFIAFILIAIIGISVGYIILLTYSSLPVLKIRRLLLPGLVCFIVLGIIAIVPLLAIRQAIIELANRLSAYTSKIPAKPYNINSLNQQFLKIERLLTKERKVKEEQAEILKIIKESDREKERFLREMYHTLNDPLNVVIVCAEILKDRTFGDDMSAYEGYFEMIYQAGRQLESYTTDILNLSEVDVKDVIIRCVTLQKRKATETRVKIDFDIPDNIPPLLADELRLRQIIISTLGQSIFCVPDFGSVLVSAKVDYKKSGKPSKLIIKIEDDGLGISEFERTEMWEKAFGDADQFYTYSRNPDITRLSFPIIRHLVKLHHGAFELATQTHNGSTFTITLPYLSRKELEPQPETTGAEQLANTKAKLLEASMAGDNVIKFPGAE